MENDWFSETKQRNTEDLRLTLRHPFENTSFSDLDYQNPGKSALSNFLRQYESQLYTVKKSFKISWKQIILTANAKK